MDKLKEKGLKVTHQRVSVLHAMAKLRNHPTAEDIYKEVMKNNPSISFSTVYNTLNTLVENGLIKIVKTNEGKTRFDDVVDGHHHILEEKSGKVSDYYNDEINEILTNYFKKKKIPNFFVKEIKLQIVGNFDNPT
jgi:Fur family peroxide stress response transcriptional regulator